MFHVPKHAFLSHSREPSTMSHSRVPTTLLHSSTFIPQMRMLGAASLKTNSLVDGVRQGHEWANMAVRKQSFAVALTPRTLAHEDWSTRSFPWQPPRPSPLNGCGLLELSPRTGVSPAAPFTFSPPHLLPYHVTCQTRPTTPGAMGSSWTSHWRHRGCSRTAAPATASPPAAPASAAAGPEAATTSSAAPAATA